MFDLYLSLARLRIRDYARNTAHLIQRHWQWFLLAAMLVPAGVVLHSLLKVLVYPVHALVAPGKGFGGYLSHVLAIQFAALVWIAPQRRQLTGGEFTRYASVLPIALPVRRAVDLTMAMLATSVLLIPLIGAMVLSPERPDVGGAYSTSVFLTLFVLTLVAQLGSLERNVMITGSVLLADLLLALSLTRTPGTTAWLLLAFALSLAFGAILVTPVCPRRLPTLSFRTAGMPVVMRLPPALAIELRALASRPGSSLLRLGTTFGLVLGTLWLARAFTFDERALPTAVLAMAAIALLLSGFHRTLRSIHAAMQHYLNTLPVHRWYWPIRDTLFVMVLGMIPYVALMVPLVMRDIASPLVFFALALAYQGLIALLRLVLVFGGRQALLLGVAMSTVWSGATLAAVTG